MNKIKNKIQHWQFINLGLLLFDIAAIQIGFLFALLLRFDFSYTTIPSIYIKNYMQITPFYTVITIIVFYFLKFISQYFLLQPKSCDFLYGQKL